MVTKRVHAAYTTLYGTYTVGTEGLHRAEIEVLTVYLEKHRGTYGVPTRYIQSTWGLHREVRRGYIEVHTGYMGDTQGHIEGT